MVNLWIYVAILSTLAEAVRFELTEPYGSSVFKTGAISRTLPHFLIGRTKLKQTMFYLDPI